MQSYQQTKCRKKRVLQAPLTKMVTVIRGKSGYGFTISGENPCVLSCIVPGSPAHVAGLRAGDLLYILNGQNVTRASHDDVVRMVGLSTGSLDLQVAESYNSSDSSDEDYLPRTKSRYHHRVRHQQSLGEKNFKHKRTSSCLAIKQHSSEGLDKEESYLSSSLTSQEDQVWNYPAGHKCISDHKQDLTEPPEKQNVDLAYSEFGRQPVISETKKISSAAALVKRVPTVKDYLKHRPQDSKQQNCAGTLANVLPNCQVVSDSGAERICNENIEQILTTSSTGNVKAFVGYIGSIETPSSHTRPHQRLQTIRNAVRRLRLEKRIHKVLMEVRPYGVLLTNTFGKQLAIYPCDRIVYSGVCPDDERFFGLVTLSAPDLDYTSNLTEEKCLRAPNSSCHIFMIKPDSPHVCQAACNDDSQCYQYSKSATSLILCIANLCRDKPSYRGFDSDFIQSQAFADPTIQAERYRCSTDSGLTLRKDEYNEQVCVVEMSNGREDLDTSSLSVGGSSNHSPQTLGDIVVTAVDRTLSSCSTSGVECWQQVPNAVNKLTPQAMPDPAYCLESGLSEVTMVVRNTENLKQNMQRYLEARQKLLAEQNCVLGSDGESYIGDHVLSLSVSEDGHAVLEAGNKGQWQLPEQAFVFAVPTKPPLTSLHQKTGKSAFHLLRSPSAPLDKHSKPVTIDLDTVGKLSPRAFPHNPPSPSVFFRSPSAPLFPHRDSDDEEDEDLEREDPYICHILEQFDKDRRAAINDDSRRFSEGFHIAKKYLEVPSGTLAIQKWTKTGSFRKQVPVVKQSYSQSLECASNNATGSKSVRKMKNSQQEGLKSSLNRGYSITTLHRLAESISKSFKRRYSESSPEFLQVDILQHLDDRGSVCDTSVDNPSPLPRCDVFIASTKGSLRESLQSFQSRHRQSLRPSQNRHNQSFGSSEVRHKALWSSESRHNQSLGSFQSRHNQSLGSSQSRHNQSLGSSQSSHKQSFGSSQSRHNQSLGSSQSRHNQSLGSFQSRHNQSLGSSQSRHNQSLGSSQSSHKQSFGSSQSRHNQSLGSSQSSHKQSFGSSQSRHNQSLGSSQSRHNQSLGSYQSRHNQSLGSSPSRHNQFLVSSLSRHKILWPSESKHNKTLESVSDSVYSHQHLSAPPIKTCKSDLHVQNSTPSVLLSQCTEADWDNICFSETFIAGWSLAVEENTSTADNRLTTACSAYNIAGFRNVVGGDREQAGRVATWAVQFDKLLQDQQGIDVFTEFLENEFSDENIRFWKVCEQFHDVTNDSQRKEQAKEIFTRYLSTNASDPINVDNTARSYTENLLDSPTPLMFDVAQQQIIQLMRQDSYPRFLKSDLYKNMLLKELESNTKAGVSNNCSKQNSGKENGGKRRRSILPWKHQKSVKVTSDSDLKKFNKKGTNSHSSIQLPVTTVGANNNMTSLKKTTGLGIDLSLMRREVFQQKEVSANQENQVKFCRIIMPDGSTTVVCAKPGQSCRSVLSKLCEKRNISFDSVDVSCLGSDKALDLSEDISTLGSKEIVIESRVLFRLDLPDGKSVGAKAKPKRSIRNVLKPILEKYGYNMDNIGLKVMPCQEMIDLEMSVSMLDNQRVLIVSDTAGAQKLRKAPLFGLFRASEKRLIEHKRHHQLLDDLHSTKK